jgi:hypothetical protein
MTPSPVEARVETPDLGAAAVPAVSTLADTGLPADLLGQLLVKTLYTGETSGAALAERLCLPYSILEQGLDAARVERLIEVRGAAGAGTAGYRYALTDLGRDRARQSLDVNQYVGPAPVPLRQYVSAMRRLGAARGYVNRERLVTGFSHLCVNPGVLISSGRP